MVDVGAAPIDRYVVLEHLSEGGMGAIYVGKKLGAGGFEMEVVLKQLLPEFTQQEEFIDLFLREAKLSATLDHANIVHTIDLVTAGGEYFIVMEYLPGGDLRTLLKRAKRRGRRFSPASAIYICREVLSALAYAHMKRDFDGKPLRLIHRDVSPSNILVSYSGEVKLTDFGIAKAATHNSLFYKVKGKIGYMSPEQAKSESLDHRSDLYSLAVCFYEILTGERLFVHAGLTTSADEIYSQPVPLISKKVPNLPHDLDVIVQRALSIDPDKRFQTAGELNEALTRCAHRNGLLMSAPELANELIGTCGEHDGWRRRR
jgi:eukaryotic-like serine/threonine-protein kinase